jgi:hypothetical protein
MKNNITKRTYKLWYLVTILYSGYLLYQTVIFGIDRDYLKMFLGIIATVIGLIAFMILRRFEDIANG